MNIQKEEFYNNKGERIVVHITSCKHDRNNKNDLANLWIKHGFIDKFFSTTLHLDTYVYNEDGCWGRYNPTVKLSKDGKRNVINFDYMREDTPENRAFLIQEVKRLANA